MKISIFRHFNQKIEDLPIVEMLERIKDGFYRDQVDQVRNIYGSAGYQKLKQQLLGFTTSGIFTNGRKSANITEYSGLIVLDLDKIPQDRLSDLRMIAREIPYSFADFISPSGVGLKLIVKVENRPDLHDQAFSALYDLYSRKLEFEI
ncbi:MAG: BT4734/BF3469 family protein, partial [Bacteroidia bacterium]